MRQEQRPKEASGTGKQALSRRGRYIAWGAALILAGVIWAAAAVSLGCRDASPVGGAIVGVGIGILVRWCVLTKKNRDLRDDPPAPGWY